MDRTRILGLLYELALEMGAQTRVKPLISKTLQRLMFHTSFPCGIYASFNAADQNATDSSVLVRIERVLGNHRLAQQEGEAMLLPEQLVQGGAEYFSFDESIELLCQGDVDSVNVLRLPVPKLIQL